MPMQANLQLAGRQAGMPGNMQVCICTAAAAAAAAHAAPEASPMSGKAPSLVGAKRAWEGQHTCGSSCSRTHTRRFISTAYHTPTHTLTLASMAYHTPTHTLTLASMAYHTPMHTRTLARTAYRTPTHTRTRAAARRARAAALPCEAPSSCRAAFAHGCRGPPSACSSSSESCAVTSTQGARGGGGRRQSASSACLRAPYVHKARTTVHAYMHTFWWSCGLARGVQVGALRCRDLCAGERQGQQRRGWMGIR